MVQRITVSGASCASRRSKPVFPPLPMTAVTPGRMSSASIKRIGSLLPNLHSVYLPAPRLSRKTAGAEKFRSIVQGTRLCGEPPLPGFPRFQIRPAAGGRFAQQIEGAPKRKRTCNASPLSFWSGLRGSNSLPGIPRTACGDSQEPCLTSDLMCASRTGGGSEFSSSDEKTGHPNRMS